MGNATPTFTITTLPKVAPLTVTLKIVKKPWMGGGCCQPYSMDAFVINVYLNGIFEKTIEAKASGMGYDSSSTSTAILKLITDLLPSDTTVTLSNNFNQVCESHSLMTPDDITKFQNATLSHLRVLDIIQSM